MDISSSQDHQNKVADLVDLTVLMPFACVHMRDAWIEVDKVEQLIICAL